MIKLLEKRITILFLLTLIVSVTAFIITGCTAVKPVARVEQPSEEGVIYLNLIWHNHQPLYGKDIKTGVYSRPWVRVHATKDYYDMVAMLEKYPKLKVTFNLTPVLIRQLDDFVAGAKDRYWVLAEKPVGSLTEDDKRFILQRFFDANYKNIIGRYPRYYELLKKRGGGSQEEIDSALKRFTDQDFLDLQVWFNLAWIDPDLLMKNPLKALVEKGRNFNDSDKKVLFSEIRKILKEVIPEYRKLQDRGQIEVITTPYAHPILPLIYNSDLAKVGDPTVELPPRFSYPQDAIAQLRKSVEIYEKHFRKKPSGLWPAEGAVAQDIVKLVADAGFKWMASGDQVLAKSIGIGDFVRDSSGIVTKPDDLYRPYYVQFKNGPKVGIVFRDNRLSDLIGFEYSGTPGEKAADDFIGRILKIRKRLLKSGKTEPHLVSVILDGENAWEYYPNDGKAFLNALYRKLSESKLIKTTTVSDFLEMYPEQKKIGKLWPGAWFSPDYGTWIGEPEENLAWEYLGKVRKHLAQFDMYKKRTTTPEKLNKAFDFMYLAEGSDWFWWYGKDQDSGVDEYFDENFRFLLSEVYRSLGDPVPDFVKVPIIPKKPVKSDRPIEGLIKPIIDGRVSNDEWKNAGYYDFSKIAGAYIRGLYYGFDEDNFYIRIDPALANASKVRKIGFYFSTPEQGKSSPFTKPRENDARAKKHLLGLRAGYLFEFDFSEGLTSRNYVSLLYSIGRYGNWQVEVPTTKTKIRNAVSGNAIELAIPLEALGEIESGDTILMQIAVTDSTDDIKIFPQKGPGKLIVPELGTSEIIMQVKDPLGDDHGPGSYVYPTDKVFEKGVFDATFFSVSEDKRNLIFKVGIKGDIKNVWGSGIGLSLQTIDIYIDTDPRKGTGSRMLLEGRNAALKKGNGWDYAVWAEGWHQKLIVPGKDGKPVELSGTPVKVIVNEQKHLINIKIKKEVFKNISDLSKWGYACALLSQEGFPSPGVRRVRDVEKTAKQWRIGGGPDDTNHTRIMDLLWPAGEKPTQEEILSGYSSSKETVDNLTPDDFAQIPLMIPALSGKSFKTGETEKSENSEKTEKKGD